jgi:sugar phosphate isomerase/epimerase
MSPFSRRSFLAMSALLPSALFAQQNNSQPTSGAMKNGPKDQKKPMPIGLELYSVRDELKRDPQGTVRAVAQMGYQGVEFFGPYYDWTHPQAKDMRKLLDDLGIRCFSTHNGAEDMQPDKLEHARDLNLILGSSYIVQASAPNIDSLDGWKKVAENLNVAADRVAKDKLKVGYHNHQTEFTPLNGKRPIEVLAANTQPTVMLQLDVGTCLDAGSDPVEWIRANPGRIKSLHLKDWSPDPDKGYKALFGEGAAEWLEIFAAAESVGGAEYYLMEQEGSRFPELETAKKCLESYRTLRG